MTLLSAAFLLATIVYLTLAVLIVVRNRRSSLNWVCAGVLLCLALWSFTDIFHNDTRLPVERIRFFANLGSLGWCSFPSLLFIYSLILTHRRRALRNWLTYPPLVALPAASGLAIDIQINNYRNCWRSTAQAGAAGTE